MLLTPEERHERAAEACINLVMTRGDVLFSELNTPCIELGMKINGTKVLDFLQPSRRPVLGWDHRRVPRRGQRRVECARNPVAAQQRPKVPDARRQAPVRRRGHAGCRR